MITNIYDLLQAEGGSKAYSYSVSNDELATINNEGQFTSHSGPGEINVRAFMPKSPNNYFESRVRYIFVVFSQIDFIV